MVAFVERREMLGVAGDEAQVLSVPSLRSGVFYCNTDGFTYIQDLQLAYYN